MVAPGAIALCLALQLSAATVSGRVELKDSHDPTVRGKSNYAAEWSSRCCRSTSRRR